MDGKRVSSSGNRLNAKATRGSGRSEGKCTCARPAGGQGCGAEERLLLSNDAEFNCFLLLFQRPASH